LAVGEVIKGEHFMIQVVVDEHGKEQVQHIVYRANGKPITWSIPVDLIKNLLGACDPSDCHDIHTLYSNPIVLKLHKNATQIIEKIFQEM
jgi:hypothetical protein